MNYIEQRPSGFTGTFVRLYWQLSHKRSEAALEPDAVLPDGTVEMIFDFEDRFLTYDSLDDFQVQPRSVIAGQLTMPMLIGPSGKTDIFGVRLHPEAGAAVLGCSMAELRDKIVDMRAVIGSRESELFESLAAASTFEDRVKRFELYLTRHDLQEIDRGLAASIRALRESSGALSISRCSHYLGWSTRRLERVFREQVGIAPKTFARIVRFQSFIGSAAGTGHSMLDRALAAGYFDQAHLIKDFRDLAGTTPTEYFARRQSFSDNFLEF